MNNNPTPKKPKKNINFLTIFLLIISLFSLILLIQGSFKSSQFNVGNKERKILFKKINNLSKSELNSQLEVTSVYNRATFPSRVSFKFLKDFKKDAINDEKEKLMFKKDQSIVLLIEKEEWLKLKDKFRIKKEDIFSGNNTYDSDSLPETWFEITTRILSFLSPFLFILFVIYCIKRFMGPGLSSSIGSIGSGFKGTDLKKSNIKFTDVAGIEEEKTELLEVVDFLKQPKKYIDMGARIPKGVLLYGEPGTGKTLLAKAVSGEANVPFFSVAGSEFEETFVGLGASRIRKLFNNAKKYAPCIIFVDEIDSLASKRNGFGSVSNDQTLNQFLTEMDGFETNEGIIIIGSTNRVETLDPAILRSGRFDRKIQIPLPDLKAREDILAIHARNKKFDDTVVLKEVAEKTPGFSGAELENVLNEATLFAVRKKKNQISFKEIEEGIDRVVGGPAKVSRVISKKTKLLVSIHEAGHALLGMMLSEAQKVQKVTIIPRGSAGGYTITTPKDETLINSKKSLYDQIAGFLGGRAAEELIFGTWGITTGAHDDFKKATKIATQMVKKFGMSDFGLRFNDENESKYFGISTKLSNQKFKVLDDAVDKILNDSFELAKITIQKEKDILLIIAESLLILETITAKDIKFIYENKKIPKRAQDIKDKNPDIKYLDLNLVNQ